jgi:hypothetical protein
VPPKGIADAAMNRPLQFNAPFSNILFNAGIVNAAIKTHSHGNYPVITDAQMPLIATTIVKNMINDWEGHARFITQDLKGFVSPFVLGGNKGQVAALSSDAKCTSEVVTIIVNYITPILRKYWKKNGDGLYIGLHGSFNADKYFEEVYRYNCDVWGVTVCYQDFLGRVGSFSLQRENQILIAMSNILFKYCFSPTYAAERIPVDDVARDMRAIGRLCGVIKPTPESPKAPPPVPKAATIAVVPPQPPAKKTKAKLVLRAASPANGSPEIISLKGKKRCPKGYSKHPWMPTKCRKTAKKANKAKKASPKKVTNKNKNVARQSLPGRITLPLGRKRCPAGFKKLSGDGLYTKIVCVKNKK